MGVKLGRTVQGARILIVDDTPQNIRLLEAVLAPRGYALLRAGSGPEALERVAADRPDIILLDVVMPNMDGYEVCRRLRGDPSTHMLPVVMITASGSEEKIKAIEAGADDFVTKPLNQAELLARIGSLLRIKEYHDTIQTQARELAEWNRTLEERVRAQVEELQRIGRLRRFLAPQVAELIVDSGDETFLESHRREITVVFCDLRGFTAFAEAAEPEEVMRVLREYHEAMGRIIFRYEGTLERFAGDGLMVFFNDPLPCVDAPRRAVQMAIAMRERVRELGVGWRRQGYRLGFGAGIALGYATLGRIGFEGRFDYAAIGNATNLASRLCDEAGDGQVLISQRVYSGVQDVVDVEPMGELSLRGFLRSTPAYNVLGLTRSASRPGNLTTREVEVAMSIAQGLTNREIAERLVITEGTAANHVEHILNKLGFNSRAQIAAWAADHLVRD